ncbi:MAG: hypothetical protein HUU55_23570 [Myxococcales bacterium]|nr:hypothetical protein [Myxococcales bacterium]
MTGKIRRTVVSFVFGVSFLAAGAVSANAAMICGQIYDCQEQCRITKKGILKCETVCETTYECYDDGNGTGGGVPFCFTDQLTGEIVCLQQ